VRDERAARLEAELAELRQQLEMAVGAVSKAATAPAAHVACMPVRCAHTHIG
jgi:hypothetical protein